MIQTVCDSNVSPYLVDLFWYQMCTNEKKKSTYIILNTNSLF